MGRLTAGLLWAGGDCGNVPVSISGEHDWSPENSEKRCSIHRDSFNNSNGPIMGISEKESIDVFLCVF